MNYTLRLATLLLLSTLSLAACNKANTVATQPDAAAPSPAPQAETAPTEATEAPTSATETSEASAVTQTYEEPDGAFAISFPDNYRYEATDTGVIFQSTDEAFRGEVVFGSAQGNQFTDEELETFLKEAYKANLNLQEVDWQQTQTQPDGSLRIDWVGKDPDGNVLDAESFIEQRGDSIYILTLSGINKPYLDYLADAQAIVGSYQVNQQ